MNPGEEAPAAGPSTLQSLDGEVRLAVYLHFLEEGRAPTPAELSATLRLPLDDIEAALQRLAEAHVLVLEPGSTAIRMAMPFSNVRTGFRVEVPFLSWYANCAWDALGIPALLRGAGRLPSQSPQRITAACPDCDETITLHLAGLDGPPILFSPIPQEPPAPPPVVHFVVPAAHWWCDILHT